MSQHRHSKRDEFLITYINSGLTQHSIDIGGPMMGVGNYIKEKFGCDEKLFLQALEESPSSRGYVMGALSEIILKNKLEEWGYEVVRIAEKPSGGNNAKNDEARGDFYVRKAGSTQDEWLVVESKGLKSNSEFRGAKFESPQKLFRYLKPLVFPPADAKERCYLKGLQTYEQSKVKWESKNPGKRFPPFSWTHENPGAISCQLEGLWRTPKALEEYLLNLDPSRYTEKAYREKNGPIAVLETHKPSKREAPLTGINQAAPLVGEFSILTVDLFLRTGEHEFVFLNPQTISHSPGSPEHLYQNYTIDILVPGVKDRPRIQYPWYDDFERCVNETSPVYLPIDPTQVDHRGDI